MKNKKGKHHSAISRQIVHGVPHGKGIAKVRKLSKTQKRPSVMFAGILTPKERAIVFEETAKIASGEKKIGETEIRLRKFIEQSISHMVME